MSRIGKSPITVPQGVTVTISGSDITVKGPRGELKRTFRAEMSFKQEDNVVTVLRKSEDRTARSLHGLSRTLLNNMVVGVSTGFEKKMQVIGVGYRAAAEGNKLTMALGYSHPVEIEIPKGITVEVAKNNIMTIGGYDKQELGDFCAFIRAKRPPEVYKGKGIRFENEVVRKKAGKAAAGK
ncbi:MAG: 50S ribosomal protein L6 [Candidatus Obscuribacterales bacterium]|nr:50S ribosomal protein L6 [Candidatus Obscuribacterales bacterium]